MQERQIVRLPRQAGNANSMALRPTAHEDLALVTASMVHCACISASMIVAMDPRTTLTLSILHNAIDT